jgi:hypothetical protein
MRNTSYYTPSGWVFLKIQAYGEETPLVKVFGSWSGGYLNGDSWRLNSSCTKIEENENEYIVYGYSGSHYILSKQNNHITSYNKGVLDDMIQELRSYGHKAEIISVQEAITLIED